MLTGGPVNGGTATAELYDPATGNFTSTGLMPAPRSNHTATLLANGKVLLAGGTGEDERVSSELFDPDTNAFSASGLAVHAGREAGTATLLESGKVLFTLKNSEDSERGAEIYDPESGTFQLTSDMQTGRGFSTGTQLSDGLVLVAGRDQKGGSSEIYDPRTATFSDPMRLQREEGYTATLLKDGTVLMAGGWVCGGASIGTSDVYHPARRIPSPLLSATSHATTHEPVSPLDPAVAGEALELYLTGLSAASVIPPQVSIGGKMADVLFFGNAPGFPAGNQVNIRVPEGIAPGPTVSIRLIYLGRPSNESKIAVR